MYTGLAAVESLQQHCVNNAPAEVQVLSQLVGGEGHAKLYPGL
jgi:hypothetical protein